jgi:Rad3-related DNA helicase
LYTDEYEGIVLPTPFNLEQQVLPVVLGKSPDPNEAGFTETMAAGIDLLARTLRRKMLVLFTSHDALRRAESALRKPLEDRGIRLYAQGLDGGQRQVRNGFLEEGPAVLLGTASFWEGVDFPGEELEVLVMARLPFLVPTDPLVEAMSERVQSEGGDPFRDYQLPEALIRFRQGFGRLIRRLGDRGLFVVADPRLSSRSYGGRFRRSIGVTFRTVENWEALAKLAEEWFGG